MHTGSKQHVLRHATEKEALAQRARTQAARLSELQAPGPLIAESPAMK